MLTCAEPKKSFESEATCWKRVKYVFCTNLCQVLAVFYFRMYISLRSSQHIRYKVDCWLTLCLKSTYEVFNERNRRELTEKVRGGL